MQKKGEILIRHLIFGTIILTLLLTGGVALVNEVTTANPSLSTNGQLGQFAKSFNKTQDIIGEKDSVTSTIGDVVPEEGEGEEDGSLVTLARQSWNYLKLTLTSFGFVTDLFKSGENCQDEDGNETPCALDTIGVPIPSWVGGLITSLIVVFIGFIILSIIFRGKI